MADKLTILELHLHANDNEFSSDMELSSDIGDLLRRRLGLGGESVEETKEEDTDLDEEIKAEVDERTPIDATADGGDTAQVEEEEESEERGAVVEIDADADVDEEEEDEDSDGASMGEMLLFVILLGIGLVFVIQRYVDTDELEDEFEDEFEEL
jgi:vacuolar-type H+-ATPase subunit I/STV1